ncbi:MAG: glutathione S-transferase [Hyphomicrobiaceae bacterium]|nr:MAG: glutathione S-transferase [Hyphomicrobiaceae bacterium]
MKLFSHPFSPYGRKVKIAAKVKGVFDDIEVLTVDTNKGDAELSRHNPLAKIPALVIAGGMTIFDSHVICEYLDSLKPTPVLFPKSGAERWRVLTLGALGDGMLDAALLLVYEHRFRPEEKIVQSWKDRQQAKVDGALAQLEANLPPFEGTPDYGSLTIAAALGYLDFRHEGKWRGKCPKLVHWLDRFAQAVPAFAATKPS